MSHVLYKRRMDGKVLYLEQNPQYEPIAEQLFDRYRDFLCAAQSLLNAIAGEDVVQYRDDEAPCYVCSRIFRRGNHGPHVEGGGRFGFFGKSGHLQYHRAHTISKKNLGSSYIWNYTPTCSECNLRTSSNLPCDSLPERMDEELSIAYSHNVRMEVELIYDYNGGRESFGRYIKFLQRVLIKRGGRYPEPSSGVMCNIL